MTVTQSRGPWLTIRTNPVPTGGADPDVWVAELDGRRGRTEPEFLDAIGEALEFPAYYGRNWGAFHECFRDLFDVTEGGMGNEWGGTAGRPERALHLVVHHADALLRDDDPRYPGIVLDYLRAPYHTGPDGLPDPERRWAGFRATFVCAPDALASSRDRLHVAGLRSDDLMTGSS